MGMSKCFFFGFSYWKRGFVKPFFTRECSRFVFSTSLKSAISDGLDRADRIYIWGKREFPELISYATEKGMSVYRVEDGFIRSVDLGSDLSRPYSLCVDAKGVYFDPHSGSELERMLSDEDISDDLKKRAADIRSAIVSGAISKYNADSDSVDGSLRPRDGRKVILVPGQVEDDASVIYGAPGMDNRVLLERVRRAEPDAYIVYKPHPDVSAGNRKGAIENSVALRFCDTIVHDISIPAILESVDEVHTMTSLVGFEALLRGIDVHCYGMPFYAGWGLTVDSEEFPGRNRRRDIDELVACSLILYPRYIDPDTLQICDIERLLSAIAKEKYRYNNDIVYRTSRRLRRQFFRWAQNVLKAVTGE